MSKNCPNSESRFGSGIGIITALLLTGVRAKGTHPRLPRPICLESGVFAGAKNTAPNPDALTNGSVSEDEGSPLE